MIETNHLRARMSQRGITNNLLNLALEFGDHKGEKVFLNKKGIDNFLKEIDLLRSKFIRAKDKGGVVLVMSGEVGITTYNYDSYARY